MDAFDQVSEEFAQTIHVTNTNDSSSERERPASETVKTNERLPAAQQSASTICGSKTNGKASRRRRQATVDVLPSLRSPAGTENDQSESHYRDDNLVADALGDGGSAQEEVSAHQHLSPAVVNNSESHRGIDFQAPDALGGDEGAHHAIAPLLGDLPLVAQNSDDLKAPVIQGAHVVGGDEGAHRPDVGHSIHSPLVSEIIQLWRMRQRWHRAEKSLILQGKALCRAWTAGDKDAANALHAKAEKGGEVDSAVSMALMPFLAAQEGFAKERTAIEKRLRKLAQSSELWPWVAEVKGFGALNLAAILGEAGEIAGYRNPSCLWKRMGLAVIDGGRQRRVADAEKAILHGYAPARRCVAYLLGDTLIKSGDACRYRPIYTARRERTAETHADWTKAHSHNDAARVMTKRVLRDLWIEARRLQRGEAA